jgi:UDP-glucose 4-epimerase
MESNFLIIGGAGFIGSHFVDELLKESKKVVVVDDYSAGFHDLLDDYKYQKDFEVVELDIRDTLSLSKLIRPETVVIHLASNPDIAAAASNPRIDFVNGTVLTESVAEAVRIAGAKKILYASGSGVYGHLINDEFSESDELIPISPYGASKLAGEAMLCAYAHMFDIEVTAFRFANVVGRNQTHGVGYDFIKKLTNNPKELFVLGDGTQKKPYIHVTDIVAAVLQTQNTHGRAFDVFNVSTSDQISVNEIAQLAMDQLNIPRVGINLIYSGGSRGWSGDVPQVALNSSKIRKSGWLPKYDSKSAMALSLAEMSKRLA